MDNSFIEKKIRKIAREEIRREWTDFINYCSKHPLGRSLKVKDKLLFGGDSSGSSNSAIFSYWMPDMDRDFRKEITNAEEELKQAIQKRVDEKTEALFDKIENLGYLFKE